MRSVDAFDFEAPLPLPASAPRLVGRVQDVSPRIGVALSVACGRTVTVGCTGAERVSAGHLAGQGLTWSYVSCGLPGVTILVIPDVLVVALADSLMGGTGVVPEDRPATSLEQRLVFRHLGPALAPIANAFAETGMTGIEIGEVESHAPPASVGDLVALRLETSLSTGTTGTVTLALPARALLPTAESAMNLAPPPPATAAVLGDVAVTISVRLAPTTLTADDVNLLAPGDIIRLEHREDRPMIGVLDDRTILTASLGRRGRRRAIVVHDVISGI